MKLEIKVVEAELGELGVLQKNHLVNPKNKVVLVKTKLGFRTFKLKRKIIIDNSDQIKVFSEAFDLNFP